MSSFPMPGDAVRLVDPAGWWASERPGLIGIIGGEVGREFRPGESCSITFNASAFRGRSSAYGKGPEFVSCSGGPAGIATPVEELTATGEIIRHRFWRWRDLPRRDGGEDYELEVPVWEWSPRA